MSFFSSIKKISFLKLCLFSAFIFLFSVANAGSPPKLDSLVKNIVPKLAPKKNKKDTASKQDIPVAKRATAKDTAYKTYEKIKLKYNGPEFQYKDNKINRLSWWDRLKYRIAKFLKSILPDWHWDSAKAIKWTIILIGIILLLFIAYRIFISGNNPLKYKKKEADENDIAYIEQNLESVDIQAYLQKALAEKNYPLALRYLHLINLKLLANKNLIEWDVNKTNQDFLQEIKPETLQAQFSQTISIFEYVWFGNFSVNKKQYAAYSEIFETLKSSIK